MAQQNDKPKEIAPEINQQKPAPPSVPFYNKTYNIFGYNISFWVILVVILAVVCIIYYYYFYRPKAGRVIKVDSDLLASSATR